MRSLTAFFTATCLLVVSLAGSAVADSATGTYKGKTAQHRKVTLKVSAKQVKLMNFSIELKCRDGSILVDAESGFEPSALRGGKFKDTQFGSTDTVRFAGKVKGTKATGTLKVTDKVGKVRCTSPNVKFTARSK